MTAPLLFAMPGNEAMTRALARAVLTRELGEVELRAFPDGETYLRFLTDLAGRSLVMVCTLDRPNDKILPLISSRRRRHASSARQESGWWRPISPICGRTGASSRARP